MRILVYEGGEAGRMVSLPGESPMDELEELLGGEVDLVTLADGLELARRADGWTEALPCWYELRRLGRAPELIAGPCAVLRMTGQMRVLNMSEDDVRRAELRVRRAI